MESTYECFLNCSTTIAIFSHFIKAVKKPHAKAQLNMRLENNRKNLIQLVQHEMNLQDKVKIQWAFGQNAVPLSHIYTRNFHIKVARRFYS